MKKPNLPVLAVALALGIATFTLAVTELPAANAQVSIKIIMERTHKGDNSLAGRAKSGRASQRELQYMLALYRNMVLNKPPRGSQASWQQKTVALIRATEKLLRNPGDTAEYARAVDCNGCHNTHK